ncbi:MAG TPA: LytTR family DNA-binding domain-containing protein [Chitinophagaceae bacterium]|jgi:two-component system, LytTR family, response regulator|nr:LytTR family DNA-binding domain-containing protein [Chitinophagaceae bacterium]
MIRAVIIEDERLIATELSNKLASLPTPVEVMVVLGSVRESLDYFSDGCHADLIFSDIQLPDGLSFTIFEKIRCDTPSVFVTAFDGFIIDAFEHNGIEYLLKPVDDRDLVKVVDKYKNLEKHFEQRQNLKKFFDKRKERLVVKKGFASVLLKMEDIVLFYTESRVVYVLDKEGRRYMCDQNLSELETLLDNHIFFRANRQYIINIQYIRAYKTLERVKLAVDLNCNETSHSVIVSQETAPYFRKWINEN